MAVEIQFLNGPNTGGLQLLSDFNAEGLQLLNGPNPGVQLLGSVMGLGATLSENEIQELAISLAPQTVGRPPAVSSMTLINLLSSYDRETQQRVGAAIIAAGGSASIVGTALSELDGAHVVAGTGYKRTWTGVVWGIASMASSAASAYHGYRRNDSLGWGIWWFFMGALFPVVTPAIAFAQGFGKQKV